MNFLLRFYPTFVLQFNVILSNHLSCIFNFLKQVIDSQDVFFVLIIILKIYSLVTISFSNRSRRLWTDKYLTNITNWSFFSKTTKLVKILSRQRSFYPFSFFVVGGVVFFKKDYDKMPFMTPCIMYFSIMRFMQSKLKELQLFTFLEKHFCKFFILFFFFGFY